MAVKNYRPRVSTITANSAAAASGTAIHLDLSTSAWNLMLVEGVAKSPTGAVLASGGVAIWASGSPLTGPASYNTFANVSGIYGISIKSTGSYTIKFFAQ